MLCQITNYNTQKYNSKQIVENRDIHNNRLMPSVLVSSEGYMQFGLKEVMSQKIWGTTFEDLVLVFCLIFSLYLCYYHRPEYF